MTYTRDDVRQMTNKELCRAEFIQGCIDEGYGPQLRMLREEIIRRYNNGQLR